MVIGMTLFAGIVEESIYRGYAITVLQSRYGKSWAVIISSIFFSFFHWGEGLAGTIIAFLLGLLLGVLYLWRRNLIINGIAHATVNVVTTFLPFL